MKKKFFNVFTMFLFIFLTGFYLNSRQAGAEIAADISANGLVSISGEGRLYISENIERIYDNVFCNDEGVEALVTEIEVSPANRNFTSEDGVLYSKDKKELVYYPAAKKGDSFTIDNDVETISKYAFYNNQNLKTLVLGDSIKEFSLISVYGCKNLEKLRLSANTEKVNIDNGDYITGLYLDSLKEVEVPEESQYFRGYSGALYSVDYRKLYYILALGRKNITIHKNCTQILNVPGRNKIQSIDIEDGSQKFSSYGGVLYDKNVTRIVLFPGLMQSYNMPATVKDISVLEKSFYMDEEDTGFDRYYIMACNLERITADKNNAYFTANDNVLYNKKMTELVLFPEKRSGSFVMPEGISVKDPGVFAGADRLDSLVISSNGCLTFDGCTLLEKVVYKDSVESITICGYNNTGIKEVCLPASLIYIYIPYRISRDIVFYGYKNTGMYTFDGNITDVKSYIESSGKKFKSLGAAPAQAGKAKASLKGGKLKVSWQKAKDADGYKVSYDTGTYPQHEETVKNINGGNKTSCTINMAGLYGEKEIYIRAYKNINGVKAYGRAAKLGIEKFFKYTSPADADVKADVYGNTLLNINGSGKLYIDRNIKEIPDKDILNSTGNMITEIEVSPENRYFSSVDGVLYNKDKTVLISYPPLKEGEIFEIPLTVETISGFAFAYNQNLKNIVIGNSVKVIGNNSFRESNITGISIPDTIENMGYSLFEGCSQLQEVSWNGMRDIPSWMFCGCRSLKSFEIPGIVENIGYGAFEGCSTAEIKIGMNVTTIENSAFGKAARNFLIDERNQDFKVMDGVLYSIDGKKLVAYPVSKEGHYIMPEDVTEFDRWTFMDNKCLAGLTLNNNIQKFDLFYLYGCDNFEKLVLSENTKSLIANKGKSEAGTETTLDNIGLSFSGKNFRQIEVPRGNKYFKVYNGNLYTAGYKRLCYIFPDASEKLVIHEACEKISYNYGENTIKEIEVPDTNKYFASRDGVLYDKNITKIILFPGGVSSYNIPATVSDISAIKKWYSEKKQGFTKYRVMACGLQKITADKNNPYFTAKDNVLYNKDMTKLVLFPQMRKGAYIMPATASIENMAVFAEAPEMTHIEISNGCTLYTGGCKLLKEIICKEGVKEFIIRDKSYYSDKGDGYEKLPLQKIVLPSTLKRMGIYSLGLDKNTIFYGYDNTCGNFSDISNSLVLKYINDVKTYVKDKGFKYKSLGAAPKTVTGAKAVKTKKGNNIKVSWKSLAKADGYRITYKPDSKKPLEEVVLKELEGGKKTSCNIKKSALGGKKTIYISAYKKINSLKVYGKNAKIKV